MAKRMLVPLDQTLEAEAVLPFVADAVSAGATVRLLHVAPQPANVVDVDGYIVAYADQELSRLEAEALDYLRTVEARLPAGAPEFAVRFGDSVDEILLEAKTFGADVVVLTTGHHGGLSRLLVGSTAEQICRRSDCAVMIVRPGSGMSSDAA